MNDRYIAKPWHLIWSIVLLFAGTVAATGFSGWFWFGTMVFIMGVGSGVWIVFAGLWESYGRYWEKVTGFAEVMAKNRNPHLWAALGFRPPEGSFKTMLQEQPEPSNPSNPKLAAYGTTFLFDLPGSEIQYRAFSDGVLTGRPLSEGEWVGRDKTYTPATFRELKSTMEKRGLIILKNSQYPKQGYTLTKRGRDHMLRHASDGVRMYLKEEPHIVQDVMIPKLTDPQERLGEARVSKDIN